MEIIIYMEPVGKARPRVTMRGGRSFAYTPQKTAHAENLIRDSVLPLNTFFERNTPLKMTAEFYRSRPKSLSKKIKWAISRPDADNYFKLLTDALEKFIYENDSQITTALIKKRFGSPPRIELKIEEEDEE